MAPKGKDSAWDHCDVIDGKMTCKLCHKSIGGGGILRLKQHLVGIRGQVKPCDAPNAVLGPIRAEYISKLEKFYEDKAREKAIQDDIARKRELLEAMKESGYNVKTPLLSLPPMTPFTMFILLLANHQKKQREQTSKVFSHLLPTLPLLIPLLPSQVVNPLWINIGKNNAKKLLINTFLDGAARKGFKGPSLHDLRGALLQKEISSIDKYLVEFKDSWLKTGCSIMSNGWTDGQNRTIINFLVSCPRGTMFLKSVDASDKVKDAALLFELLDNIIQEVWEQHVMQVITDNASNYVLAGKMLETKYKTIFWTP
eukprot:PITA_17834